MKTADYLDECKGKLLISSTYQLSKTTGISEQALGRYYSGQRIPDEFMCFKIAEILELDPAYVIASIKGDSEKNEKKASYFRSFSDASSKIAVNTVLLVLLNFIFLIGSGTRNDFNALGRVLIKKRYFV